MAIKMSIPSLILIFVLVQWDRATAQSSCTMAIVSLSPCMNYVTGNSSTPSSSCCSRLSSVISSQPQCLCSLLKGGASNFGIVVNQTQALALPGACNVQTPPVSRCDAANGPAAPPPSDSPSESPVDESPDVPSDPTDVPSGSKTVPTTNGPSIGGSNTQATLSFFTIFVLISSSLVFTCSLF